jgi:hypothetical protein
MIGSDTSLEGVREQMEIAAKFGVSTESFDIATASGIDTDLLQGIAQGGVLWFTDLTQVDSTLMLPTAVASISYASLHFARGTTSGTDGRFFPKILDAGQVCLISALPLMATLPSGVFCYMGTSATWGLFMGFAMRSENFRRAVGLPTRSVENSNNA